MQKTRQHFILLGIILLCGFVLRFWHFFDIPFTFDELSAMSRTTFNSFSDMIRIGVVEKDSHPAGVQTFLFYWSMLFSEREYVIKLPFLIAGIISVFLSYRIGDIWFGKTTGILTAAYVCSLQLFVMYSQIARPYISGLFFTLFAVLFWSKYFFQTGKMKYLIGFVTFSALAAYNHYFSLLFVTVLGFSGLVLVSRKNIVPYVISGVIILMLYIPHLSILFAQAEKGTIGGWLGAPGPYFLVKFIYWLFHYSYYAIAGFIVIFIVSFIAKKPSQQAESLIKKRILLLFWLIPAPLFGYVYSLNVEPILQNSLLIFTTPYLFILLFSFVGEWKFKYLGLAVVIILLINTLTLVITRNYYKVFYHQPFEQLVKNAIKLESDHKNDVFIINDYIPYYTNYFFRKYKKEFPYFTTRNTDINIIGFKQRLNEIKQNYIITSGLDDIYFQVIKETYPCWIAYDFGFTFEQYTFSKDQAVTIYSPGRKLVAETAFGENELKWQFNPSNILRDESSGNYLYTFNIGEEYGLKFETPLKELINDIYWIFDIEVEYMTHNPEMQATIVGELKNEGELLHWQGSGISQFGIVPGSWQKAFLTIDIQKALKNRNKIDEQMLKIYIWNRGKKDLMIKKINVFLRPGNPDRYSL